MSSSPNSRSPKLSSTQRPTPPLPTHPRGIHAQVATYTQQGPTLSKSNFFWRFLAISLLCAKACLGRNRSHYVMDASSTVDNSQTAIGMKVSAGLSFIENSANSKRSFQPGLFAAGISRKLGILWKMVKLFSTLWRLSGSSTISEEMDLSEKTPFQKDFFF